MSDSSTGIFASRSPQGISDRTLVVIGGRSNSTSEVPAPMKKSQMMVRHDPPSLLFRVELRRAGLRERQSLLGPGEFRERKTERTVESWHTNGTNDIREVGVFKGVRNPLRSGS